MPERKFPNILFILTDDQGVWSMGCYGNHEIRTPNLDRLAAQGTRVLRTDQGGDIVATTRGSGIAFEQVGMIGE